jgi:hypothetical protein
MEMERDLQSRSTTEQVCKLEIDIRKIMIQLGLDKSRWPLEWREPEQRKMSG